MESEILTPLPLTKPLCATAAAIHQTGFNFPWTQEAFESLLILPTTKGWITNTGLLICTQVCDEMEILTICVTPDSRQHGIGTQWMNFLTDYARQKKIKRIFLEVSVLNQPAQRLYQKSGFQIIGKRKNYYRTESGFCDALCMEKVID